MQNIKQYYRNKIASRLLGGKLRHECRFWLDEVIWNLKGIVEELKFQVTNW